jgi:hypothetical protein
MIVIPMAGKSRRFIEAGYQLPKFELLVADRTLFYWSVASFRQYFAQERFLFVLNKAHGARDFVLDQCAMLGINHVEIVELSEDTRGQAETVTLGLQGISYNDAESLIIFNIDTIRPAYAFPDKAALSDGYIETFHGEGDGWSFVMPAAAYGCRVQYTTEKVRISDHCSTGLYYFGSIRTYTGAYHNIVDTQLLSFLQKWKELYIAPMYNFLIEQGHRIAFHDIPRQDVIFSGIPREYEELLIDPKAKAKLCGMLQAPENSAIQT